MKKEKNNNIDIEQDIADCEAFDRWIVEHPNNWHYVGDDNQFELIGIDESELPYEVKRGIEIINYSNKSFYELEKLRGAMGLNPDPLSDLDITITEDGTVIHNKK